MRNKLLKARPHSFFSTSQSQDNERKSSSTPPSTVPAASVPAVPAEPPSSPKSPPSQAARPSHERPSFRATLTLASEGSPDPVMPRTPTNGVNGTTQTQPPSQPSQLSQPSASSLSPASSPQFPNRMNSTIRTVSSFEDKQRFCGEDSSSEGTQSHATSRNSALSSSINSMSSEGSQPYYSHQSMDNGLTPTKTLRSYPSMVDIPQRESSLSKTNSAATLGSYNSDPPPGGHGGMGQAGNGMTPNEMSLSAGEATMSGNWDNSVGKAGLGKTGRVINRLVSDNEALKRDIKIEQLKAEEARQTARLLEDKLDRTISDYESRLLEASVTKTLLARKERQVESLQATVELERSRAVAAGDRERVWKDTLEDTRAEAKRKVEEATNYAALMEGRYNAIASHWKDQGEEAKRLIAKMAVEIAELNGLRRGDDEKIRTLRDLCDQQNENIRKITEQKLQYYQMHEAYKAEQEKALKDIKTNADLREKEQEAKIAEAQEVLNKLKWALNVKNNIPWAE